MSGAGQAAIAVPLVLVVLLLMWFFIRADWALRHWDCRHEEPTDRRGWFR